MCQAIAAGKFDGVLRKARAAKEAGETVRMALSFPLFLFFFVSVFVAAFAGSIRGGVAGWPRGIEVGLHVPRRYSGTPFLATGYGRRAGFD